MPNTNSWLCIYAIAQLGRPYWYATHGQISTEAIYANITKPAIIRDLGLSNVYTNYQSQLGVKVHDCSGLIVGALTCDGVNSEPSGSSPVFHQANAQYTSNCTTRGSNMTKFPRIPGTLVFHTGSGGNKSHVGIYVGKYIDKDGATHEDIVVEAMGHDYGVTTTPISHNKWDSWGQLDCCEIDTAEDMVFDARLNSAIDSQTNTEPGSITIQTENMRPFVATVLGQIYREIDYSKLREDRVSAMMFFGGELFDASHKQRTYINPKLSALVKDCNNSGFPYALYVNVRAKNNIEADAECRALYYIISQFSPKLGLWLSLQTNNPISVNNSILEIYYRYITKWGLSARCGLYITKQQLSSITWNSFKDRYYLWYIDPMNVTEVDDELLQPEMFEVPD